jgi:hypothetical protein
MFLFYIGGKEIGVIIRISGQKKTKKSAVGMMKMMEFFGCLLKNLSKNIMLFQLIIFMKIIFIQVSKFELKENIIFKHNLP